MRHLDRSVVSPPRILERFVGGFHHWNDLGPDGKAEVRRSLEEMQGRYCAYCECSLDLNNEHIEHFRPRRDFNWLTFAWSNLFLCCDCSDRCGHHKDSGGKPYDPNQLIDPSLEDPDRFFRFKPDGTISIRSGLSPQDQHRARETIRVFRLDPEVGGLRRMRRDAIAIYHPDIIEDLMNLDPEERLAYIADELAKAENSPFATMIRHYFEV